MTYHLAQINIARFRLPVEDPANAEFIAALDRVNAIADVQPGFVWRLKGEANNALEFKPFDDANIVVNMSVWRDMDALAAFVYRSSAHREIMRRRREWLTAIEISLALWWVRAGAVPTIEEGRTRLETLTRIGPSPAAFTFKSPFPAPDAATISPILDECA
jgi:heme-degrading monooxygenase HmoA